jgi:predicted transcriptional regulator
MNGFINEGEASWTFLTNHAHVLLCLAKSSSMRMKDIAVEVGITERAVQRIIADLISSGCIFRTKDGRCNTYRICMDKNLNHPIEAHKKIADLVGLIVDNKRVDNKRVDNKSVANKRVANKSNEPKQKDAIFEGTPSYAVN